MHGRNLPAEYIFLLVRKRHIRPRFRIQAHRGIVLTGDSTSSNRILKNKITNSSRYGITLKNAGFKNEIAYNDIQNTSLETDDTGGIEVTQGNRTKRSGSHIHHNRVRDSNGVSYNGPDNIVSMSWGIYLDSFAGGYTVENNLTWRNSRGGFMVQGGKDNVIRNNIFADSSSFQGHFNNFSNNSETFLRKISSSSISRSRGERSSMPGKPPERPEIRQ